MWDNCETIWVSAKEVKEAIIEIAKKQLPEDQQDLVLGDVQYSEGGQLCSEIPDFKVFFLEEQFLSQLPRR